MFPGAPDLCDGVVNDCDATSAQPEWLVAPGGDYETVQAAVDAVPAGEQICVGEGTFDEAVVIEAAPVTLVGAGSELTIIDGAASRTALVIRGQAAAGTTIAGIRLQNGIPTQADPNSPQSIVGGGLYVSDTSIDLQDVAIVNCTSDDTAAGAAFFQSTVTGRDVVLRGNVSAMSYGGLYALQTTFGLDGVVFDANASGRAGGGAGLSYSTGFLRNLQVTDNSAGWSAGGGLYLYLSDNLAVESATFTGNQSGSRGATWGAGMSVAGGTVVLNDAEFRDNYAMLVGGGISVYGGTLLADNVLFAGNRADLYGGGISVFNSSATTLTGVTLVSNTGSEGGGIYTSNATIQVSDSIVFDNLAVDEGGGVYVNSNALLMDHTALSANTPGDVGGVFVNPVGSDGNVDLEPTFQSYVGTDALLWDLQLVPNTSLDTASSVGGPLGWQASP